jgi:hypothetical protein
LRTRIGYVVKLRLGRYAKGLSYTESIADADVFFNKSDRIPVVVTEEPGPPVREVVELVPGVTIDEGMKFAIRWKEVEFWIRSEVFGVLAQATLYDSITLAARRMASEGIDRCTIVGIREVPGPTVRTVKEITPEMLK